MNGLAVVFVVGTGVASTGLVRRTAGRPRRMATPRTNSGTPPERHSSQIRISRDEAEVHDAVARAVAREEVARAAMVRRLDRYARTLESDNARLRLRRLGSKKATRRPRTGTPAKPDVGIEGVRVRPMAMRRGNGGRIENFD